ncbi:MAG: type II toxin-antitoxin system PemK/MazF family toxin [Faecalibacillus sp.]
MIEHIKRGEIYLADLNPYQGSEQGGIRPVLIIQNDIGNYYSHTTIIAPITNYTNHKKALPTHVILDNDVLSYKSIILCEQLRVVDKKRLIKYVGKLDDNLLSQIKQAINVSLAVN